MDKELKTKNICQGQITYDRSSVRDHSLIARSAANAAVVMLEMLQNPWHPIKTSLRPRKACKADLQFDLKAGVRSLDQLIQSQGSFNTMNRSSIVLRVGPCLDWSHVVWGNLLRSWWTSKRFRNCRRQPHSATAPSTATSTSISSSPSSSSTSSSTSLSRLRLTVEYLSQWKLRDILKDGGLLLYRHFKDLLTSFLRGRQALRCSDSFVTTLES